MGRSRQMSGYSWHLKAAHFYRKLPTGSLNTWKEIKMAKEKQIDKGWGYDEDRKHARKPTSWCVCVWY